MTFRAHWRGRKARGNPLGRRAGESNVQLVDKAVEVASTLDPSELCGRSELEEYKRKECNKEDQDR
jgi:hypothetical protein